MSKKTHLSRRRFLQQLALAAGSTSLLGYKGQLDLIQSALAASCDAASGPAKSLVCVFLYGGNDAFNMFVPYDDTRYAEYAASRQNLALPKDGATPLLPVTGDQYAFHPALAPLRDLYNANKLAVISNVGNLIVPTTRADYLNEAVPVPVSLFSHSHQQEIWQTNLAPASAVTNPGWGGLLSDLLQSCNDDPAVPLSFSTNGSNLWESGNQTQPFSLDPWNGAEDFEYLKGTDWPSNEISRSAAWDSILNLTRSNPLLSQQATTFTGTKERVALIRDALALTDPEATPPGITIATPFDTNNNLATQLRMIARMIYARSHLGQQRQIFFAAMGGWDTHGNQLAAHNSLYGTLGEALSSFQATLEEFGLEDSVVTFTASEFGRTLTSNGDGTDHGWGNHTLVMGGTGAVNGGAVYGNFPSLALGSANDSGEAGRLIPELSVDQHGATLAKWMGLSASESNDIFPNLHNFSTTDLGFLV